MREELITSAVSFLSDPKVQSAPLAKKVSFLESKGMTSEEIEEAMSRANGKSSSTGLSTTTTTTTAAPQGTVAYPQPGMAVQHMGPPPIPPRPKYDWRDIFIAAVLAGGVGYGVWTLAKRLFGPWFQVPTQKELEEDKEKLDAQFQAVEDSLKDIKEQSNTALTTVTAQSKKVDESLANLETVIKELKEGESQREEEFKNVKTQIDALKELLPKSLDRNKEAQNAALLDLQNEMKSLKSLLVNRRATSTVLDQVSSAPSTPTATGSTAASAVASPSPTDGLSSRLSATLNASGARAGIPAWQMASSSSNTNATSNTTAAENKETTEESSASSSK